MNQAISPQFGCLSFHEYCRIHHEFCHQRSASSYLVPDLNLHACSRLWHRSAWRMWCDVTMQTICQVIMEKREGDGEMMQGTKEGKNGRKKKNRKMKIKNKREKEWEQKQGNSCIVYEMNAWRKDRVCLSPLHLLQNLLWKVTLGVYTKGVTQIKFWLGSVLCELLMKVCLLYAKSRFNFKILLGLTTKKYTYIISMMGPI